MPRRIRIAESGTAVAATGAGRAAAAASRPVQRANPEVPQEQGTEPARGGRPVRRRRQETGADHQVDRGGRLLLGARLSCRADGRFWRVRRPKNRCGRWSCGRSDASSSIAAIVRKRASTCVWRGNATASNTRTWSPSWVTTRSSTSGSSAASDRCRKRAAGADRAGHRGGRPTEDRDDCCGPEGCPRGTAKSPGRSPPSVRAMAWPVWPSGEGGMHPAHGLLAPVRRSRASGQHGCGRSFAAKRCRRGRCWSGSARHAAWQTWSAARQRDRWREQYRERLTAGNGSPLSGSSGKPRDRGSGFDDPVVQQEAERSTLRC